MSNGWSSHEAGGVTPGAGHELGTGLGAEKPLVWSEGSKESRVALSGNK